MKRLLACILALSLFLCVCAYSESDVVQKGDSGSTVMAIQKILVSLNYLAPEYATGDYDDLTEVAVLAFQIDHGITPTGIADPTTQQAITQSLKDNVASSPSGSSTTPAHANENSQAGIANEGISISDNSSVSSPANNTESGNIIASGNGWEITKEYYYSTRWSSYYYYAFVLKNTSGYNAEINVNVRFYAADGTLIGVDSSSEHACENGQLTFWSFSNDIQFARAETDITVSKEEWYEDGSQSCMDLSTDIIGNKAIITAKNNGTKAVKFLEYHVLFLDGHGEVVSTGWGISD